jgi:hypothetical protein
VVRRLLARDADRELKDRIWGGTPLDWARHAGLPAMEALLR